MRRGTGRAVGGRLLRAAGALALALAVVCWFGAAWYRARFGATGFDSILFTVLFHPEEAESDQIRSFLEEVAIPVPFVLALLSALLRRRARGRLDLVRAGTGRRIRLWPLPAPVRVGLGAALCALALKDASDKTGFLEWAGSRSERGLLYAEHYVDPKGVDVSFPERKRNLVCIYLESCETSFFSREQGGMLPRCAIPELYALAAENVNFSHDGGVGGWSRVRGTSWTAGALCALTAGIPFSVPVKGNAYGAYARFLPGAWTLGDVLHAAGYRQVLLVGSDSVFGGRDKLYLQHGTDEILDTATAARDGLVPEGYRTWWGFEDSVLFEYARRTISSLASEGKPFAVTVETVDTHGPEGFLCDRCGGEFAERYENVWACSSRQTAEFVDWLRAQPFWEDTTVLLCGDHLGHGREYFRRALAGRPYDRHVYNCILNAVPPAPPEIAKNRAFSPMDLYPTVLAAMGCTIPGERLGLGVNLFSGEPTLCETLGRARLDEEIGKRSREYETKLVLGL